AQQRNAMRPVGEVWKRHNRITADTGNIAQHAFDVLHHLQCGQTQHRIEGVVVEDGQTRFQIALNDMYAACDALRDHCIVDLDTVAAALLVRLQIIQHHAIAAAEIQHMRFLLHPVRDEGEVRTEAAQLPEIHACAPSAGCACVGCCSTCCAGCCIC